MDWKDESLAAYLIYENCRLGGQQYGRMIPSTSAHGFYNDITR